MHTLRLNLKTGRYSDMFLDKAFTAEDKLQNIVVSEGKKRLRMLKRDKEYKNAKRTYGYTMELITKWTATVSKIEKIERSKRTPEQKKTLPFLRKKIKDATVKHKEAANTLNTLIETYELTEASLQAYAVVGRKNFKKYLSSHQAQEIASRVYQGVEKVLYGNGEDIHFKKRDELHTIASKSFSGIRYYDVYHTSYYKKRVVPRHAAEIEYMGRQIEVDIPSDDPYVQESLQHEIKYVQIERKYYPSGWKYYVILYLEGDAPKKITKGKGMSGVDPGVSSIAMAGEEGVLLEEIAPRVKWYNAQIEKLQVKIDKSMRGSNPGNYNTDGTVKKGKHEWVYTKACQRYKRKLKTLYRKKAEYIKMCEFILANKIIEKSGIIRIEKMNYKALAKRAKGPAVRSEKASVVKDKDGNEKEVHKFKKKKRLGKSINDRAPAQMVSILKTKASLYDVPVEEIKTSSFKASQYHHDTDTYIKPQLSERYKDIAGRRVQRDLYSAFLIWHSNETLDAPDRESCKRDFYRFANLQDDLILEMIRNKVSYKPVFGF